MTHGEGGAAVTPIYHFTHKEVVPGRMHVWPTGQLQLPHYIINFPTKRHWRGNSRIQDIISGLEDLVRVIREYQIKSIAVSPLGCGNGGLSWSDVRPLIIEALQDVDVEVLLFPPNAPYGPYAENLNHVLITMDGHYTTGYGDRSREPHIGLVEGADRLAVEYLKDHPETLHRLSRVSDLVRDWETPYGLELLATVHWALTHANLANEPRQQVYRSPIQNVYPHAR
jgi:Macro domain